MMAMTTRQKDFIVTFAVVFVVAFALILAWRITKPHPEPPNKVTAHVAAVTLCDSADNCGPAYWAILHSETIENLRKLHEHDSPPPKGSFWFDFETNRMMISDGGWKFHRVNPRKPKHPNLNLHPSKIATAHHDFISKDAVVNGAIVATESGSTFTRVISSGSCDPSFLWDAAKQVCVLNVIFAQLPEVTCTQLSQPGSWGVGTPDQTMQCWYRPKLATTQEAKRP